MMARQIAAAVFLAAAAAFATISAFGILRSRSNFAALHASGIANVMLAPLALLAIVAATGFGASSAGMLVLAAELLIGAPIVSHGLAVAEHRRKPR